MWRVQTCGSLILVNVGKFTFNGFLFHFYSKMKHITIVALFAIASSPCYFSKQVATRSIVCAIRLKLWLLCQRQRDTLFRLCSNIIRTQRGRWTPHDSTPNQLITRWKKLFVEESVQLPRHTSHQVFRSGPPTHHLGLMVGGKLSPGGGPVPDHPVRYTVSAVGLTT